MKGIIAAICVGVGAVCFYFLLSSQDEEIVRDEGSRNIDSVLQVTKTRVAKRINKELAPQSKKFIKYSDSEKEISELVITSTNDEVLDLINSLDDEQQVLSVIVAFLKKVALKDQSQAIAFIERIEDSKVREWARAILVAIVSESDPAKALQIAQTFNIGKLSVHYKNIFTIWAKTDPEAALNALDKIVQSTEKESARRILFEEWAKNNPQSLISYLKDSPSSKIKNDILGRALVEISKSDVSFALDYVQTAPLGVSKKQLVAAIIGSFDVNNDLDLVTSWINVTAKGEVRTNAIIELIPKLGSHQMELCNSLIESLSPGTARELAVGKLAISIIENNPPERAMELATKIQDPLDNKLALRTIFQTWATREPLAAADYALARMGNDQAIVAEVIEGWASVNPRDALSWVNQMLESDLIEKKTIPKSALFQALAYQDPTMARSLIDQNSDLFPPNVENVTTLAFQWTKNDPPGAAAWINTLPASENKNRAYQTVAETWISYDSIQASKWISGLDSGNPRNHAIVAIVNATMQDDPETAYEWSNLITDSKLRQQTIDRLPPSSRK